MAKVNDQVTAQRLLKMKNEGFTWYGYLLKYFWYYVLLYVISISTVFLWAHTFKIPVLVFYSLLFFVIGLSTGVVLRDVRWMRATKENGPFTLKTTHWEMIEYIAKGVKP